MVRDSSDPSSPSELDRRPVPLPPFVPQRDRIKIGSAGVSAFPNQSEPAFKLIPFCLWDSFRQPHILYYLLCTVIEYFKFCNLENGEKVSSIVEATLIVICIVFQVKARYATYGHYSTFLSEEGGGVYRVWNQSDEQWQAIMESDLRVGQLLMVEKYLQSNPKLNPVNLLPIATASNSKHLLIKTSRIDKKEEYTKVKMLKNFHRLVTVKNKDEIQFNAKIFDGSIEYRFISRLGSSFQAELGFKSQFPEDKILMTDVDIIPRGIPVSTEDFVIGVVLHTESFKVINAKASMAVTNKVGQILHSYMYGVIIMNIFLLILIFVINLILTSVTTSFSADGYGEYIYCFVINLSSNLNNVYYISMHILIYIHRTLHARVMRRDHKLNFKNSIKSLDELAQTDTLIMDDYFFMDKIFNTDDFCYILNEQAPLKEHFNLIMKVMQESPLLKKYMLGHTIPVSKYFRIKKIQSEKKCTVKILKEELIDANTLQIMIKVITKKHDSKYIIRFSDKPVASTIHKIRDEELKYRLQKMKANYENQKSNTMFFFLESIKVQQGLQMSRSSINYLFYAAFSFSEALNENSLKLVKSIPVMRKYNIVILTSKNWKYINYYMEMAKLKIESDSIFTLEQKQEKDMHHILRNYRKTLRDRENIKSMIDKCAILFINSSMTAYLSRKSMRKAIFKLAAYCKYIVFYDCSQYQKQICAVNLFSIFPDHIFLSNFICDSNILQYSNISICEKGASSEIVVSMALNKFKDLEKVVFEEAVRSIQMINYIVSSCAFKNQMLFIAASLTFLLIYRGGATEMGVSYVSEIYFFFNFVFTILPISFMIAYRPALYIEEDIRQYLSKSALILINIKAILFGGFTTFIIYALLLEEYVGNVLTSSIINCIIAGNLFLLVLDDSLNKTIQVIIIIIQIIISVSTIVFVQMFSYTSFQFVQILTNFDRENLWFFFCTFLISPVICFLVLFAFSAGRELKIVENKNESKLKDWEQNIPSKQSQEQNNTEIVLKMPKSRGKHFDFQEEDYYIFQ